MFDKENFTHEFYDKLSDSEKKELVQVMLEDQLTDPLHIKGLPKPVQNSIRSVIRSSAKAMKEETIAGYPDEWINGIKSKDEMTRTLITDNHERRIHDQSIYKLHGRQVLQAFFDEPYHVMMPEDVKMMRGMCDEISAKFHDYVESDTGMPRETITIYFIPENVREKTEHDVIGDAFVPVFRAPRWVEQYLERQRWIDGIRDPEIDILTGCTQNFKQQQSYDKLKALHDILDTEDTDRNGRIWKREFMKMILNNQIYLTTPRGHEHWLWLLKLLELQKSYEVNLVQTLENPPSTKLDLKSVIHMKWPKQNLSNLKAHDFRYGKWHDQALINYATGDVFHIDTTILDSLATFGPYINSGFGLLRPNLNDIDKKKLEKVIKKGRKRK